VSFVRFSKSRLTGHTPYMSAQLASVAAECAPIRKRRFSGVPAVLLTRYGFLVEEENVVLRCSAPEILSLKQVLLQDVEVALPCNFHWEVLLR